MKLYELKKQENILKEELSILHKRFILNNSIKNDTERDYCPSEILDEIIIKSKELEKISFKVYRYELNIKELVIQNEIYKDIIFMLENTIVNKDKDYTNVYDRVSIDNKIKEYKDKINLNLDTIDYYYFVTEDND